MFKKLLLLICLMPSLLKAQEVSFRDIMYWAGDAGGENIAALLVHFNNMGKDVTYVWGYRWSGEATGEDMIRAVAKDCGDLYILTQYTGSMGNTLCGIGCDKSSKMIDGVYFDFDTAQNDPKISFDYFSVNSSMGQTSAPAGDTPTLCENAINEAKTSHVIDHPINKNAYGYPAYDYDHWKCSSLSYTSLWQSGWYLGYWSYWVGDSDLTALSYSGLGMSSVKLKNGDVNGWGYMDINAPWGSSIKWGELDYEHSALSYTGIRFAFDDVEVLGDVKDMKYKDTAIVSIVTYPEDADYGTFTITNSDGSVASYASRNGKLSITGVGTTVLTAVSDSDPTITCSLTINTSVETPIKKITVENLDENGELHIGYQEMISVNYTVEPEDASLQTLDIEIEDPTLFTIYAAKAFNPTRNFYELTTFNVGETYVTYKSKDGSGKTARFKVVVEDRERDAVIDYTKGQLWLNEEWFGHNNGSINFVDDDYNITYKAYERENPWQSFGATSQYAAVYGNRLVVMSKQAQDGGDLRQGGGRVVIADAKTLQRLASFDEIGADGRSCVGVNPNKYYIGSATGIRVLTVEGGEYKLSETNIEGIAGKNAYSGQIGDMICAGKYVFVCQQSTGLHIVDGETDELVTTVADTNAAGVTQTADGRVWFAAGTNIYCIDPETLEVSDPITSPVKIDAGWGSWRSANFVGSKKENVIFFNGASWGAYKNVYKWNVDEDMPEAPLFTISELEGVLEGASTDGYGSIGYDVETNQILVSCTTGSSSNYRNVWYYFVDAETGSLNYTTKLRPGYLFPAMPVIVDRYEPEFSNIDAVVVKPNESYMIDLSNYVTDKDDINYNIRYSLDNVASSTAEVSLSGSSLTINAKESTEEFTITLSAESRGVVVAKDVTVKIDKESGVEGVLALPNIKIQGNILVAIGLAGNVCSIYDLAGRELKNFMITSDNFTSQIGLSEGVYIIKAGNEIVKINL